MTPAELADEIEEALWKVGEASGEATYTQALADVGRIAAKNSRTLLAALRPPPQPEERALSEADIIALMRDPRYWRQRDPEVVKRVTDGFRALYGDRAALDASDMPAAGDRGE